MAWGRRRAGPGLPAPPLSVPDVYIPLYLQPSRDKIESSDANARSVTNTTGNIRAGRAGDEELYQVEVYSSKEESLEMVRRRIALREPLGPALVTQAFARLQQSNPQ